MKKKGLIWLLITSIILSTIVVGCNNSDSKGTSNGAKNNDIPSNEIWELDLGYTFATNSPQDQGARLFAEKAKEYTNDRVKVTVYADSQLGADTQLIESMMRGTTPMSIVNVGTAATWDPRFNILMLPYLVDSYDMADDFFYNEGAYVGSLINEYSQELGFHNLAYFENEFRGLSNDIRPVKSIADMQGLKVRVAQAPSFVALFEAFGTIVTPMAVSELYTGLQQGTVDGQDNGPITTVNFKFHEVQDYYTLINHMTNPASVSIVNEVWDSMPADVQEGLTKAAHEASFYQREISRSQIEKSIQEMKDIGIEVTELNDEQMKEFTEVGLSVWDDIAEIVGDQEVIANLKQASEEWHSKEWTDEEWLENSQKWMK